MRPTKRARSSSVPKASAKAVVRARASAPLYRPVRSFAGKNLRRTGFPDQLKATLKFCEALTLGSPSGILQSYLFSANGLYDPNITGTGGQPLYFDQLMAIYDHYTVNSSKCTITIAGQGSTSGPQVYCALLKDDDPNTNYTGINALISDDTTSWGITGGVSNIPLKLYKSFSAKNTYGITDAATDSTMSGTATTNPGEQTYYRLSVQECQGSNTVTCNFMVEIEYDCTFRERKDVVTS